MCSALDTYLRISKETFDSGWNKEGFKLFLPCEIARKEINWERNEGKMMKNGKELGTLNDQQRRYSVAAWWQQHGGNKHGFPRGKKLDDLIYVLHPYQTFYSHFRLLDFEL